MSTTTDSYDEERISAYLDGELTEAERAEVEQLLDSDPAARRLADALTEVSEACRELPSGKFSAGLADRVLAEAKRRIEVGADKPIVAQADRLEPEGDFGLPFGRSSRGWAWAGVAAAAAVMISFYGRTDTQSRPPATTVVQQQWTQEALNRFRQAAPNTKLVTVRTSPEGLIALQQKMRQQGIQLATNAPQPVQRLLDGTGLQVGSVNKSARDQLMLITANPQQ